jgi:DNA-binding CsgD family transcriptional regulator
MDDCPLTPTEIEILELLSQGLVYKQIAARRETSISTVRSQLQSIYRKLDVIDRAQAVLVAHRAGWINAWTGTRITPSQHLLIDVRDSLHRLEQRLPLSRRERTRLARFEHELITADRGPVGDRMLDELGAVLTFVDRYGKIPSRGSRRQPNR